LFTIDEGFDLFRVDFVSFFYRLDARKEEGKKGLRSIPRKKEKSAVPESFSPQQHMLIWRSGCSEKKSESCLEDPLPRNIKNQVNERRKQGKRKKGRRERKGIE
jgi:hypothetical protein